MGPERSYGELIIKGLVGGFTLGRSLICFPKVKRILKSGNRTIVFWSDDTKTIVKRADDEPDNDYAAFTAALGVKIYKTNSALKREIATKTEMQEVKKKSGG